MVQLAAYTDRAAKHDWGCLRTGPHLLHGDSSEPRETQSAGTSGRDINHPTAHIRASIGDRDDDTAAIGVIGNMRRLPKGSVLCAAVNSPSCRARPLAVLVPSSRVE